MEKSWKYRERAVRATRALTVASFFMAMLGLLGGGYCEHEARFSTKVPDPVHEYTNGIYFKGETRYVNDLDYTICTASGPLAFSAVGLGILFGGVCYLLLRHQP